METKSIVKKTCNWTQNLSLRTAVGKDDVVEHVDESVRSQSEVVSHAGSFHAHSLSIALQAQPVAGERAHAVVVDDRRSAQRMNEHVVL